MSTNNQGCTGNGDYTVATSAVGPVQGLHVSKLGAAYTPRIGLVGTKVSTDVPTVSLMVWTEEPKPSTDERFKDLTLGDELSFHGYTVKIISICAGHAHFDLVSQTE